MMRSGATEIAMGALILMSFASDSRAEADPSSVSALAAPARQVLSSLENDALMRAAAQLSAESAAAESVELAVEDDLDGAWSKESVAARLAGLFGFLSMIVLLLVRWSGDDSVRNESSVFDSAG